ncbi:MAG: hypothetical protein IPM06_21790 [Rhizobiales bacterium]|nr:hypothetical protein [Hyphomicrobiales bacterium]
MQQRDCRKSGGRQECNGNGTIWDSPEAEQAADDWTRSEPPTGDGYQIWETVSEGSPISPVFATPEELAQHMAGTRWGADKGSSVETWLKFINGPGWAPSMVIDANGAARLPAYLGAGTMRSSTARGLEMARMAAEYRDR